MSTASPSPVLDASTSDTLVRFHLSLNVSNLARSLTFYRVLLDAEPAKAREDYAKFELNEPPLVLSLMPGAHAGGGALNHVGLRLIDAERLVQAQARLEMAGYTTQREEGVACCYARQTKFWVTDPDRTLWELYILHDDDVEESGYHRDAIESEAGVPANCCPPPTLVNLSPNIASCAPTSMTKTAAMSAERVIWFHNLTQALPERLSQADDSVDEVQLQGTFNVPHEPARLAEFLNEVLRVLRPGGQVLVHGLVAERPLTETPALPGPAALVSHVPVESWPAETLAAAGFINLQLTKLAATPNFVAEEIELREIKVVGYKPSANKAPPVATVIYRGPFRAMTDDEGHEFIRGQRVAVCAATLALLKSGPLAEQFTFLD